MYYICQLFKFLYTSDSNRQSLLRFVLVLLYGEVWVILLLLIFFYIVDNHFTPLYLGTYMVTTLPFYHYVKPCVKPSGSVTNCISIVCRIVKIGFFLLLYMGVFLYMYILLSGLHSWLLTYLFTPSTYVPLYRLSIKFSTYLTPISDVVINWNFHNTRP